MRFEREFTHACDSSMNRLVNVQVNLESRQYVIPDDKRRDDVRWQARVKMAS